MLYDRAERADSLVFVVFLGHSPMIVCLDPEVVKVGKVQIKNSIAIYNKNSFKTLI